MKSYKKFGIGILMIGILTLVVSVGADGKVRKVEAEEYEIVLEKNKGTYDITTIGKSGYHCNIMYPWKIVVRGQSGKEKTYKKNDAKTFGEKGVSFQVIGKEATLKLSVCNDKQCVMKTEKLKLD